MIGTIPKAYPDELIYSVLARAYVADGYMIYREFAEDVFVNKREAPSVEFLGGIKPEVLERLCVSYGVNDISNLIRMGTQYPYYTRFYTPERKKQALDALIKGESIIDLIRLTTQKEERYIRYCPKCVLDDRSNYGETYWHRSHQMKGVNCCHKHGIRLVSSGLILSGKASPNFHAAEIVLQDLEEYTEPATEKEMMLAQYNKWLLEAPLADTTPLLAIKNELWMQGFISRGGTYRVAKVENRMKLFYRDSPDEAFEKFQITKFIAGKRIQPTDYARMALFLNIDVKKLLSNQQLVFNEFKRNNPKMSGGCPPKDWKTIDYELLPKVKQVVDGMIEKNGQRPKRITAYLVAKNLGFPYKSFLRLEDCTNYVKQYEETQEEFWAREVEWCYFHITQSGEKMQYASFRKLLNVRRSYMIAALPYIKDVQIKQVIEEIAQL